MVFVSLTKWTRLRLSLYRHWSLFDSICHSRYTACRFVCLSSKNNVMILHTSHSSQLTVNWDVYWVLPKSVIQVSISIEGSDWHLTMHACSGHDPKNLRITPFWRYTALCTSLIINMVVLRFRVWTMKGKKKLYEFLADMG